MFSRNQYDNINGDSCHGAEHIELVAPGYSDLSSRSEDECSIISPELFTVNISQWSSCYINLTSTCIGAGIIGIPFAFAKCGWVLGTVLILVSAALSAFGSHLLAVSALRTARPASFYTVAQATMPRCAVLVDVYIALICFLVTASYLFIIADSLPLAMQQLGAPVVLQQRWACVVLCSALVAPLSFLPSLDALKVTSWLSGAMLLYLVLLIFLYSCHIPLELFDPCLSVGSDGALDGTRQCKGSQAVAIFDVDTVRVISIFIFNFSCQQNVFTIVNELHDPTPFRLNSIFVASMTTASALYIITTYSAYATFGSFIISDILQMYPGTLLTTSCRIMICLIVTLHFPIQLHPVRRAVMELLARFDAANLDAQSVLRRYNTRYYLTTTAHLLLSLAIALSFDDLGIMFAVLGSTGSTLVIFILPGLFYFQLHRRDGEYCRVREMCSQCPTTDSYQSSAAQDDEELDTRQLSETKSDNVQPQWKLYAALGMLGAGCIIMPLCLIMLFI